MINTFQCLSKIHDHFRFPMDLDMGRYLSSPSASKDNLYVLHSILVHGGDVGGGHYYALICIEGKWYKFDDEIVLSVSENEAIWMHYGRRKYDLPFPDDLHSEVSQEDIGGGTSTFSAYMLVYIRQNELKEITRSVTSDDIPPELKSRIDDERRKLLRKELIEIHHKVI